MLSTPLLCQQLRITECARLGLPVATERRKSAAGPAGVHRLMLVSDSLKARTQAFDTRSKVSPLYAMLLGSEIA